MSKPEIVLNVDVRERTGRGGAREARRADKVPGILYGGDKDPVSIAVDKKTISQALKSGKFISHTVTLEHKGERQLVFTQDIQFHPVTDEPTHLDLFRVEKGQIIKVRRAREDRRRRRLARHQARRRAEHRASRSRGSTPRPTRSRRSWWLTSPSSTSATP